MLQGLKKMSMFSFEDVAKIAILLNRDVTHERHYPAYVVLLHEEMVRNPSQTLEEAWGKLPEHVDRDMGGLTTKMSHYP